MQQRQRTPLVVLAETESYAVVVSEEDDGEHIYNLELGNITLHLYQDEWAELLELINSARSLKHTAPERHRPGLIRAVICLWDLCKYGILGLCGYMSSPNATFATHAVLAESSMLNA